MPSFTIPLNIPDLEMLSQAADSNGKILISVTSTRGGTICRNCGKTATKRYGTAPKLSIRHLPVFDTPVMLVIKPVRYQCEHCDDAPITTEKYNWCDQKSGISKGLEEYLMRSLINTTIQDVARKERIGYKSVASALNRQVGRSIDWSNYSDLNTIGIDEISLKKGHNNYLTIISNRSISGEISVIAVLHDRYKDTVKSFLQTIPEKLRKRVKSVCTDMYDGFVGSVKEVFGCKVLVIDRYHVSKLYRAEVDKLRKTEMTRLKAELSPVEYAKLEGMMWILRKRKEYLSKAEKEQLTLLFKYSPDLKKAYKYALKLTNIFNTHCSRKLARIKVNKWIKSVQKSSLNCFKTFISTLEKYKTGILNYFKSRKNSGFVEGLNNKLKVMKRRCYGVTNPVTVFQRLFLDFQGLRLYFD